MDISALWASLPNDVKTLLLGAGGELTAGLLMRALDALGTALRGTPQERALRQAYARAGATFLACFDLPEDPQAYRDWLIHVRGLLQPLFDDGRVQAAFNDAVLYTGQPEAVDPSLFLTAWAERYGAGGEATLPWREEIGPADALRAFALAFEREAAARPELHTFLMAARLKRIVDLLQAGVRVWGMEALLQAAQGLADQQERLLALFTDLARLGYSVRSVTVQGDAAATVIITGDNNQVGVADAGLLASLFRRLPDPAQQLAEYRAHLRRTCAYLPPEGLALPEVHGRPLDPNLVRIPLDRVYIKLRALPREGRPEEPPAAEDAAAMAGYIRAQQRRRREWEEESARTAARIPIPPEQAVAEHAQLIILGDPGAGKSTFLRHLAWADAASAGSLPLLVPLGRADLAMQGGRSLLEAALDVLTAHKVGAERAALRAALEQEITARRVHWLWDGLDEVRLHRREVVDALARLAADGQRLAITSRPLGYQPIPGCDALYEVLPLLPEDARAFVDHWFAALAAARRLPAAEQQAWAEERARWLRGQLDDRPGLREVAQSPLMLTFLAVLAGDEPRRDFPRRRKDLYAAYVERLFTAWEARRRGGEDTPLLSAIADPHEAREVALWGFRRIALHLHRAYGEQPERAGRPAVKEALAGELAHEMGLGRFQAMARAEAILGFWEQAGLLDRYRLGEREWLAFRHLTFQEYGAARALAEAHEDNHAALWAVLEPHLLDPEWTEVIPLALAHLEDATPLLKRLLAANTSDAVQQRLLFWAAMALAEGARGAETVRRQVVDELERIVRTKLLWEVGVTRIALNVLSRLGEELYATQRLLALARDSAVDARVRTQVAEALGRLGRAEEAAPIPLALARDGTVDAWVRLRAAEALGRLGRAEGLLALARDGTVMALLRVQAAWALGRLGQAAATPKALAGLRALAEDPATPKAVRRAAQEALRRLQG